MILGSSFVKQAFEGEYPKLLRLFNELWRRLQQNKFQVRTNLADDSTLPRHSSVSFSAEDAEEEYE